MAHGQTIKTAIQNRLAGKDIFETHSFDFGVGTEDDPNAVWGRFEARFNSRIDRDDILNWIQDQVQNSPQVKNWVTKASIVSHLCTHDDESVQSCRTTEYVEWER